MDNYEQILHSLYCILGERFGVVFDTATDYANIPIRYCFDNTNTLNCLYFLLEIAIRYNIMPSNRMMENCMTWSLNEYALEILKNKHNDFKE